MAFDVARVRAAYPALADGDAHLDGAAGTQVPAAVADAIAGAWRAGIGNLGGAFPGSERSRRLVAECRRAFADLVGGDPGGVVLGPNMTTLTYRLAGALAAAWGPGDEVVVSRLDHDANVRPWVQAAARAGATVRWAEVDLATGELPAGQYDALLSGRARLVAVTAASNVLGTRPDVAAITARAHAAGALTYVDGVHAAAHGPVDLAALGADFLATSAYKWSGPHVGAVAADPGLLSGLHPDKLASSPDAVPERFELGTPPFADYAGVVAAVDHLAALDPRAGGTRRARLVASTTAAEAHEQELFGELLAGLDAMEHVRTFGRAPRRTATAYFTVAGRTPRAVAEQLAARGVNVWNGHNYAWELTGALGIRDAGGACARGWSTTTTAPTWTGCSTGSPSCAPSRRQAPPGRRPRRPGPPNGPTSTTMSSRPAGPGTSGPWSDDARMTPRPVDLRCPLMGDHLDRTSNEGLVYAARTDRCRQTGVTADDDVPGAEVPAQSAR